MAEYILLKENNENGKVALNKSVFGSIVEISLKEIDGIVAEDGTFDVVVKIVKNKLEIVADVTLAFGVNVKQTCEKLQQSIYDNILIMTNIKCNQIHIDVNGFKE